MNCCIGTCPRPAWRTLISEVSWEKPDEEATIEHSLRLGFCEDHIDLLAIPDDALQPA